MEFDVTIDRDKYIGGSDIPVIMGLSPYASRYDLLLEKAGLKENTFAGNKYTDYGTAMEPKIRAYINEITEGAPYEPNRVIKGRVRCHTDGFNGTGVLEIKTTSRIYYTVDEYKVYLVQLLKYLEMNDVTFGVLAVYHRPEDFSEVFNSNRLHIYCVSLSDYRDLLSQINEEIDRFLNDLDRLKENPLLSEEDFQTQEVVTLSRQVIALEAELACLKTVEKKCKDAKAALFKAMEAHNVKSWTTPNGTKITRVDATPALIELALEFDADAFVDENPDLAMPYMREVKKQTRGKAGYVRITLPK